MEVSIPNQYGSNLGSVTLSPAPAQDKGLSASYDMAVPGGDCTPLVLSTSATLLPSARSSTSGGRSNSQSGSVRQAKKPAARKVSAEAVRPMEHLGAPATPRQTVVALAAPTAQPLDEQLLQEASKTAAIPKAKRSKAVPAAPARASSRSKGAKGNMPSLQRAQLLQAQKNLEISGNPPSLHGPRFFF